MQIPVNSNRKIAIRVLLASALILPALFFLLPKGELNPRPEPEPLGRRSAVDVDALQPTLDTIVRRSIEDVWMRYLIARDADPRGLDDFRGFLDEEGLTVGETTDPSLSPEDALNAAVKERGIVLEKTRWRRDDDDLITRIVVELELAALTSDSNTSVILPYEVSGRSFAGLDFALLANTVNCLMCHAEIDNAARIYCRDILESGRFPRVRVGTLKHLQVRSGKAQSRIAGTLYTRGRVLNETGGPLDIAASTLNSARFDEEGRLLEDVWGGLIDAPLDPAGKAGGNFYVEYPQRETDQVDGILPRRFPSVFNDRDNDHTVDDDEFAFTAQRAKGVLLGGQKVLVPRSSRYQEGGLPKVGKSGELRDVIKGHLVACGTMLDPLVIEGTLALDGDLVIAGRIKGSGSILVRGNIYIVDSLVYADGVDEENRRTFGEDSDGKKNRLALAAGGSIIMGDPMVNTETYSRGLVTGRRDGALNFTMSELLLFNRLEWTVTQEELPGANKTQVKNPLFDPDYLPRYYTLRKTDPVYVMNRPDKDAIWFDPELRSWAGIDAIGDWSWGGWSEYGLNSPVRKSAVIHSLLPGSWLDDASYRGMLNAAAASGRGFEVDGLLYTDNALILAAPRNSVYSGRATVNGSIIAADLGVFAPGDGKSTGFRLNYDDRPGEIIDIRSERYLEIR